VQYYIFALVFLIFDVETVFLFPWAAAFDALPFFAVVEGVIFILILVAGLIYAWRKGVLEWS
jgi:NADH:ubiquinone oxidoreductase subunit 3 (subunit A)